MHSMYCGRGIMNQRMLSHETKHNACLVVASFLTNEKFKPLHLYSRTGSNTPLDSALQKS